MRPPIYDWEDKKQICYELYVDQKKSMEEIRTYMKERYGFEPSRRSFQLNFNKWQFPGKRTRIPKSDALIDRIRQLWQRNVSQKDMLSILEREGFQIKNRDLSRIRSKNNWMLRGANGYHPTYNKQRSRVKRNTTEAEEDDRSLLPGLQEAAMMNPTTELHRTNGYGFQDKEREGPRPLPLDIRLSYAATPGIGRRDQRRQELEERSAELYATKKRRRRIRGWGGLPADPPAPPRFPSETTLDEAKAFLHLDNKLYRQVREHFVEICQQDGVNRKADAGPGRWSAAKEKLIAQSPHLNRQFFGPFDGISRESKGLGLDVICMDVTKRLRTTNHRMTIAEAKSTLGVNPQQGREIRSQYYDVLVANNFTSRSEAGSDYWKGLRQHWIDSSDLVQSLLSSRDSSDLNEQKYKAIDIMCRDVMKRLRDDITRRDPSRRRASNIGPGPGPAPSQRAIGSASASVNLQSTPGLAVPGAAPPVMFRKSVNCDKRPRAEQDTFVDPGLSSPTLALQTFAASTDGATVMQSQPAGTTDVASTTNSSRGNPVAALFRLNPVSSVQENPKLWMDQLMGLSYAELVKKAGAKHRAVLVRGVEGMLSDDSGGFDIQQDDELGAYLDCAAGLGRVVFSVTLDRRGEGDGRQATDW